MGAQLDYQTLENYLIMFLIDMRGVFDKFEDNIDNILIP